MEIIPLLPGHWPIVKEIYEAGLGIGEDLLQALIEESETNGIWRDTVLLERRSKTVAI